MLARLLPAARGGGSVIVPPAPTDYTMLFNGTSTSFDYDIFHATSTDSGVSWTESGLVLARGAGGSWDDDTIVDPSVIWNGSQWVMYYAGHDGSIFRIGRATSSDRITWTKDAGNPILTPGGGYTQMNFPTAYFDVAANVTRLWYAGWKAGGAITMGYAEVDSGGSLTGVGEVLGLGSGGAFDDSQVVPSCVVKDGSTFYIHYAGYDGTYYHSGYATCTTPDTAGTYSRGGVLTGYSGDITMSAVTYHSNQVRSVVKRGSSWDAYVTLFHSGDGTEVMGRDTGTGPAGPFTGTVSGPLIPLSGSHTNSAENPCVVET